MMINFYNLWNCCKEIQFFSIRGRKLFASYYEIVVIIFNLMVVFTIKGKKEMTKQDIEQIDKIIKSLDTAVGTMLVTAMRGDVQIKKAMEIVSQASFDLNFRLSETKED